MPDAKRETFHTGMKIKKFSTNLRQMYIPPPYRSGSWLTY